jgi:hypothetical protein
MAEAVITADIVHSTALDKKNRLRLFSRLNSLLSTHKHEFYRGDSFQVYLPEPQQALEIILQVRLAARRTENRSPEKAFDIRASLGIGRSDKPMRDLRTATGEVFILSGRAFDQLKETGKRLAIQAPDETLNLGFKILASYLDLLITQLTYKQSEVIFELLLDHSQLDVARQLKKSQATVSQHVQSARWPEINILREDYLRLIAKL